MGSQRTTSRSKPKQQQIIGIVGGLGPWAHIELERNLLLSARRIVGAARDQDFPEWILSSIPQTPDRTLAIENRAADPTDYLVQGLKRLETHRDSSGREVPGADFAIIACISAHKFLPAAGAQVSIPVLNMVAETARAVGAEHPGAKVGLLATSGTLTAGFFHSELRRCGLTPVSLLDLPDGPELQRALIMETIYGPVVDGARAGGGIKGLGVRAEHVEAFTRAAEHLVRSADATVVIPGCTEIGLALKGESICGAALVDPMRVISDVAIRRAYGMDNQDMTAPGDNSVQ